MKTKILLLCLITAAASGCAHLGQSGGGADASGYYAGHWYGPNPNQPLGELNCTITATGGGNYDALFFAVFGGMGEYEVPLKGTTQDGAVVFDGSVDLGETSGGVFDWKGSIVDDVFNGTYTSKFINGTFKMSKTEKPPA